MLWLLLCLLPPLSHGSIVAHTERHKHEAAGGTTALPHIYFCRSPNMEDFTCWWHPLSNLTEGGEVTHILTYSKETETKHECPDYMTGGPNSCHFDSSHTSIWTVYCMTVTAITTRRNYTSKQHCVDVAEIVQTETPVNLTYNLTDADCVEMGQNVLISWTYPEPAHVQYGWITLVYELQYRHVTEPDNWKAKHPLREPQLELLGLPVDDYVVRVRCRAQHSMLWSDWSSTLLMSIPPRPSAGTSVGRWQDGKLLVLTLGTAVGVVALLVITCSLVLQSKRIKEYFLPLLLKKGNLDKINRHFSNFHSYKPHKLTSSSEESWDHVSTSDIYVSVPTDGSEPTESDMDTGKAPCDLVPSEASAHHRLTAPNQRVSPHRSFAPSLNVPSPWPMLKVLSGTDYNTTEHPGLPGAVPTPELTSSTSHSPQDIYACIQLLYKRGEVHLVPGCRGSLLVPTAGVDAAEEDKNKEATSHQTRENDGGEAAVPLLPVATGNSS